MQITADQVRQLREMTGAGMMECKKALAEAAGDVEKAVENLRKAGIAKAEKRGERAASEGLVEAYIHPGNRIGVLIEVNCETDFVARTPEFGALVRELAMQVAAAGADFVTRSEVPAARVEKEKEILLAQMEGQGKPANMLEKIVQGKIDKFFSEVCLMEQPYIKDDKQSVGDLVKAAGSKTGENIVVRRFSRFRLGQD
ncbi:MAG: translation elongation factor Ts [Candidatus Eisenbacteria bacterium]|uniref:Elongation factor Ts n=1 Tax=Eiseniibacteriota bacterium TaxID=2212470 RepID=A0A849SED0_UNCEI|nr:translation elongation factor Ts [Candidatus Eisenbacteria bacterium]